MKDLSLTQKYLICTVNEKGALPGYNQKMVACLIVSGLLEMQMAKCISISDKKITVCTELPEHMEYLTPLYNVINQGKPIKAEKAVETYTIAFTNKKLYELIDSLTKSLREADVVEPVKTGLLGNKDGYAQKKEIVMGIIEKIRAELLEDGEISENVIALTALMDKAGNLKDYFSKYEQKELKGRIEAIKKSKAGTLAKEMSQHIEALDMAAIIPLVFTNV
ncbi:MAG: GPP34 family phosphoprotein [Eubacterium sp.]|nr:GPP34 family phosphoprotein [Eubacterium sp.]MCI8918069.1 GPP34 family phosphoprotein [Eubacterium sp.]